MDYSRMTKAELIRELKKRSRTASVHRALGNRRSRKEDSLRHSDEMLRIISENAGDLIAILDLDGRRVFNSRSYEKILGDPAELEGTDSFDEIHPEDRERIREVFDRTVLTGVGQRSEYRFLLKDGSVRYIESMGNLIRDEQGNPSKVLVVSRDVTEARFSDRKIRLLAQTVASTKDCVAITDLDSDILFVNDAFVAETGFTQDELVGRSIATVLSENMQAMYRQEVMPGTWRGSWNGVVLGRKKDGSVIPQELWTSLVRSEAGDPVAIVGVMRDISDRVRAEKVQRATYRISEATQAGQTFEELLRFIHGIIGEILPARNFYIALYDETADLISFPYFVDEFDDTPSPKRPGRGLTEYVLRTGRPLLATPDRFAELVRSGDVEEIGAPSIDWLGVPLTMNDKTLGVIVVQSYSEGTRFTRHDIEMLTFVSGQVAMSIERSRALESLRASEARFRAIFERAGIGMVMTDLEGRITASNASLQAFLGVSASELTGMSISEFGQNGDRTGNGPFPAELAEAHHLSGERQYRHKNGSIVWGELTSSFIRNAEGKPLFWIGMIEDITRRKRVEERLSKLNECFLSFSADPLENINRLTALCGELLGAASALYNRLDSGMLCSWGQWGTPPDYVAVDSPDGHICYDVIRRNHREIAVLRNLHESTYAGTDPGVLRYNLRTYVGIPVHFGDVAVGSLCTLYQSDFVPTEDDKRLLGIIAAAISVEEQRKHAAESLAESEFRYRALFENANDAILLMREDKFIGCNRETEEMFGCEKDQILNRTPFAYSPGTQPDGESSETKALRYIRAAIAGTPQHFEWQHSRLDGTLFDAEVSLSPIEIKGETIVQAIVRDITSRKRSEESLRESEMRFSVLAEAAFEGVGVADQGRIILASDQLARMLGYDPGEMVGMKMESFVAPEARAMVLEKVRSGATEPYEHLAIRKDGSVFPVEVRARALPYKGKMVRVSAVRDITERRRAEETIRTAEAKFRALIEHSSEAIGLVDGNGVITYESPASITMLGYAPEELIGKNVFDFLTMKDQRNDVLRMAQLVKRPGSSVSGQVLFHHKDGSWRWLDVVGTNLLHEPAVGAIVLNYRDITERKLAEEQLYRSRQMLRLVLDNIPQRVFWKDRDYRFVGCNRAFATDAGYHDPAEVVGRQDFDMPWKEIAPIYRADDADVMDSDTPKLNYEEPLTAPDGSTLWLKTSKVPLHDLEGRVIGVLGTYEDITQRKYAQEEILLEKTRFQQLYENVSLGIAMLDEQNRVLDVNPAFSRIFQYTLEELKGRIIDEVLVPPEFRDEGSLLSAEVLGGTTIDREGLRRRKDGTLAYVHIYGVPVLSRNDVIGIYGIYEDISERRVAEEKIREQATLLDVSRDAIRVQDLQGTILYWNKGAELLYGSPASEMIGKRAATIYRPESIPLWEEAMASVLGRGEWSGEVRQQTLSGREVVAQSRWSIIRDHDGRPKSVLVVSTDITEKKKLEAQFHHAQRLETIGTLAGGIAHDLNNVLAPILMSIELLQSRFPDVRSRRLVETIESSARRGSDIVKQVLTFARGVEGERVLLQPKHLLRDMERIAMETFPKSIEIRSDIPKALWTLQGDATQLHQVLLNLCINARDAMPQGGELNLSAANIELDEDGARINLNARPGKYVMISVRDNGVGIPAELLEKIFDPFFTTKEVGKGTGLGLSTVLGIVESHKGFITVDSKWGTGTEFRVYFPAVADAVPKAGTDAPADLPRGNGECVLIVDDEPPIRDIMRESLESYGYTVREAKDGLEAAVVFEKHRGDIKLVLTDMMMPTMDGTAVIRLLRRLSPTVKIIIVTGMAEETQLSDPVKQSIQGFLQKPFKAEALIRLIDSVLRDVPVAPYA